MSDRTRATPTAEELFHAAFAASNDRDSDGDSTAGILAQRLSDALAEVERLSASREDWRTAAHDDVDEMERLRQRAEDAEAKFAEAQQREAKLYEICHALCDANDIATRMEARSRLLGLEDAK